jgi:hypothetical protein
LLDYDTKIRQVSQNTLIKMGNYSEKNYNKINKYASL